MSSPKKTHTQRQKKKKNSSHALPTTLHLEDRKILSHHSKLAPRIWLDGIIIWTASIWVGLETFFSTSMDLKHKNPWNPIQQKHIQRLHSTHTIFTFHSRLVKWNLHQMFDPANICLFWIRSKSPPYHIFLVKMMHTRNREKFGERYLQYCLT